MWFVPLAGVGTSDQLVDAVAGVLNPQKAGPITELLDVGEALHLAIATGGGWG